MKGYKIMEDILNFIGNYAFPIVMCLILVRINEKQDERHKEETEKLNSTLINNTEALIELKDAIERRDR